MTKKYVICCGDSYTAGDELNGNVVIPGYTEYLWSPRQHGPNPYDNLKNQYHKAMKRLLKNDNWRYYYQDQLKMAWPAYLQRLIDTDVVNIALGGISNQEIAHRAMHEFHSMLEYRDPKELLVIIMVTSSNRIGFPQYNPAIKKMNKYQYQSFMSSWMVDGADGALADMAKQYFLSHNDYDLFWESMKALFTARQYIESYGTKVVFVDSCLLRYGLNFDLEKMPQVDRLVEILNPVLSMDDITKTYPEPASLPGGHFCEEIHKLFAEQLADYLKTNQLL